MSKHSEIKYYQKGKYGRYEIEVWHDELNKYQLIGGSDKEIVIKKAQVKMAQWDEIWEKKQSSLQDTFRIQDKLKIASERTIEANQEIEKLKNILKENIQISQSLGWMNPLSYTIPMPIKPELPVKPILNIPREPQSTDTQKIKMGPVDRMIYNTFGRIPAEIKLELQKNYESAHDEWVKTKERLTDNYNIAVINWEKEVKRIEEQYQNDFNKWENDKAAYYNHKDLRNKKYLEGDIEAILEHCDTVLGNSEYPDYFPHKYNLDYNPLNKILIMDYQLPSITELPTLVELKFVKSNYEFVEKHLSNTQLNNLYDDIVYQVCLRSVSEIFEADKANVISSIVFNGFVESINPATGKNIKPYILSLHVTKNEFKEIDLSYIDVKACFKKLKGISSSKLHTMTPIAPIISLNKEDRRFIDSYEVMDSLEGMDNIAAMDWEDFEHLVRELFEKEFAREGAEVKVTRASRDGGIDAVVFDPDPMRGGKFVIQAKRYTNTVGVSAVRDLYGSVINEGANKGILVSTADYGPDAYEFAKDKPLVLLDGGHLLYLLEKHGKRAKIDLIEAKRILNERKD